MLGHAGASRVDVWLIARRLSHAAAQVVGHSQLSAAAEKCERAHVTAYLVRQLLASGRFDVGVVRRPQHGYEHLRVAPSPVLPSVTSTVWPA